MDNSHFERVEPQIHTKPNWAKMQGIHPLLVEEGVLGRSDSESLQTRMRWLIQKKNHLAPVGALLLIKDEKTKNLGDTYSNVSPPLY